MINLYSFLSMALLIVASTMMGACGGLYGQPQPGYYPGSTQQSAYNRGGPVGRTALAMNNGSFGGSVMIPSAGGSIYANSGFDPGTHAQILAQYNAQRPPILTAGGTPGVVMVPNAGEVVSEGGMSGGGSSNRSSAQLAASSEHVRRLARALGNVAATQASQGRTIAIQGRTLGRIEQRLERVTPPSPAASPTTSANASPSTGTTVWMDEVD